MFNKRWYDQDPTLSLAISLLQNTPESARDRVMYYLKQQMRSYAPDFENLLHKTEKTGFWSFLQQRQSMTTDHWYWVEGIKYLKAEQQQRLAKDLIQYIYLLERYDALIDDPALMTEQAHLSA